jgi:uncharacterized protein YjdB
MNKLYMKNLKLVKSLALLVISTIITGSSYAQLVLTGSTNCNAFLQGNYVEVGINGNGAFGSSVAAPSGYHPKGGSAVTNPCNSSSGPSGTDLGFVADPAKDGWTVGGTPAGFPNYIGDYFLPGSPFEGWSLEINGTEYQNWNANGALDAVVGSFTNYTNTGTHKSATWQGQVAGLAVQQVTALDTGDLYFTINVTLTNTTGSTISNVYYGRYVDPDNEVPEGGSYTTKQHIDYQLPNTDNNVLVSATGLTYGSYLGLGTRDCRALCEYSSSGLSPGVKPDQLYAQTGGYYYNNSTYPSGYTQDAGIGLVFSLGSIAPGASVNFAYAYILDSTYLTRNAAFTATAPSWYATGDTAASQNSGDTGIVCQNQFTTVTIPSPGAYTWTWTAITGETLSPTTGSSTTLTTGTTIIHLQAIGTQTVTGTCTLSLTDTLDFYLNPQPVPTITGTLNVCMGSTTTLSDSRTGGSWSSGNTGVATVGSSSGVVSPVTSGTVTMTYTTSSGCITSAIVTVNPLPAAITGTTTVCINGTTQLNDATAGGTWSSSNASEGSIGTTGLVAGISAGTPTITYTLSSTGCYITTPVVVNSSPLPAAITGTFNVCTGQTTTLSDATSGGTWSSSTPADGTISSGGTVTGISAGVPTITYLTGPGCYVTAPVTVNPAPSAILGTPSVCTGSSVPLSDGTSGGNWSTSDVTIATISGTGSLSGIATGNATIDYTLTSTGCYTSVIATVNATPNVSAFSTSVTNPCQGNGASVTINSTSLAAGIYNVTYNLTGANSATGVVGSVTMASNTGTFLTSSLANAGSTTIQITSMTNVSGCSSTVVSGGIAGFTVNANPGTIFVPTYVCTGSTITVSDGSIGGTWTSNDGSLATVVGSTGVVTGVASGNPTISYTLGTGCYTTTVITVNPTPNVITGSTNVCTGNTVSLGETSTGGTWSSSNSLLGSVNSSGVVAGIAAGTPTISYTLPQGCYQLFPMTINATPAANTGTAKVCAGLTTTLANGTGGGTWTSNNGSLATVVGTSGVVTGVAAGTPTISYTLATGCYANTIVTVNLSPAGITGASSLCIGTSTSLGNTVSGGTWTSSNSALGSVSSGGSVTGIAAGTPTISYTLGDGCFAIQPMTINANPSVIGGSIFAVCTGSTITLTDGTSGGTWSSNTPAQGSVDASGHVTGVAAGTPTISYTTGVGCYATQQVTVNLTPGAISGPASVCIGTPTSFTNSTGGGTWSSSNTSIATVVGSTGSVTGATSGSVNISYIMPSGCYALVTISVNSNPAAISGTTYAVCTGTNISLTDATSGGTWSSSNPTLGSVSSGGSVTGLSAGTPTISYTMSSGCYATQQVTVSTTPNSISGAASVCIGATTSYTSSTGGGTWSSSNSSIASVVGSTGAVTGVAVGNATISYVVPSGCYVLQTISVNPNPAAIGGTTFVVCTGSNISLNDGTAGGTWSSSNATLGSISAGGSVAGLAVGVPTISYTLGTGCYALQNVTVNATPSAITGTFNVCVGSTTTLTDATLGGSWSSSSLGLATVVGSTGTVTGVASGNPSIIYTAPDACTISQVITVNALPSAIAGATAVCVGANTTLTDASGSGTWSSSDGTKATINSGTGVVTGVAAGPVTMTYTNGSGCYVTYTMTVNPVPNPIGGATNVCVGLSATVSDLTGGGTWSSSNTSLATVVGSTGSVTGVAAGYPNMTYTLTSTGCYSTSVFTVNPLPSAIAGSPVVCVNASSTLSSSPSGGTWSSSNSAQGSIVAATGVLTGVSGLTNPVITYTLPTGCIMTVTATVNPLPSAITGTMNVCTGNTTSLSDPSLGGNWSSSNTALGTVSGTGVVAGIAAGIPIITYTLPTTGCYITTYVTVNQTPSAITGTMNACVGSTSLLSDASSGGSWSASSGLATVSSAGLVTGVTGGSLNISYTSAAGCYVLTAFSVNPLPAIITGSMNVCVGATTALNDATGGGTWSISNPGEGTISAGGVVTGIAAGNPIVTYTLPSGCVANATLTINALPAAITGTFIICTGVSSTMSSAPSGGTWADGLSTLVTVGSTTGVVTGVTAGSPIITYTLPTGCSAMQTITVNTTPPAITGTTNVCVGATTVLNDALTGGSWSSSNTTQATVAGGTVSGLVSGVPLISYSMPTGCYATIPVTVNPNPAAITGAIPVCTGSTIGLGDVTASGVWTSSNTSLATVNSTTGVVTGVALGNPNVSYTLATGCYAISQMTVNTTPAVITGPTTVCTGSTIVLNNATAGGTWSSSNTTEATVSGGTVSGLVTGSPVITYSMPSGCFVIYTITVNQTPAPITGAASVCVSLTTTLSETLSGGLWSSSNPAWGSIGSTSGIVTGVSAGGNPTISYMMPTGCFASVVVTVNPIPAAVTGTTVVCAGSSTLLNDVTPAGTWSSGNTSVATVGTTGLVTGVSGGATGVTYTLGAGCYASTIVTVNPVPNISSFTSTTATSPCVGTLSTVTINSTSLGAGTFTVTYSLSGANTSIANTATLTMGTSTGTFTIPSSLLASTGSTTVTINSITNGYSCSSSPSSSNTASFAVNALPTVYNVTGGGGYCSGGTGVHIYLSNSVGGVNYQLYLGASTVGSPIAGTFSGLDFGAYTTVGTYTVNAVNATTGCTSNMSGSATVSVNPLPNQYAVTGGGAYCIGGTGVAVGLAGSDAGKSYQLYVGTSPIGTPISGSGSSISFGLETTAGTYTVVATDATTFCTSNMTGSVGVTINPLPSAISGTMAVCQGATTTLTDVGSGTWSTSSSNATVNSTTGVVTGVTGGTTATITYTLGTTCSTTTVVTINSNPVAVTGPTSVCAGSTVTVADGTSGGTFTSSNTSIATVSAGPGIVSGINAGVVTISYTLSTGCAATYSETVNPAPAAIGGSNNVCTGFSTTLTNTVSGGTWTSSAPATGSIGSATGILAGILSGTLTVTYTLPAGCNVTMPFSVNPTPSAITGTLNACVGSGSTLADASSGGGWTSSNPGVATAISTTGLITGVSAGTLTITYTLPAGCTATTPFTVNPMPVAISGPTAVCVNSNITLTDGTSGGTWTSSNPAVGTISSTGILSGLSAGATTVTYTLPAGSCSVTYNVTVNPLPATPTGVTNVCVNSTTTLSDATTGGNWTSSNTAIGSVGSSTGTVAGLSSGVTVISYTLVGTGCISSASVTVNPLPAAIVTPTTSVCSGSSVTLTDASAGGTWSTASSTITVGGTTGVVMGTSSGSATITYTLPTGCLVTTTLNVNPSPLNITGATFVCTGASTTLSDATSGGTWSSSNTTLATVGTSGVVTAGTTVGTPYITYTLPAGCFTTYLISVNPTPAVITGTLSVCSGQSTTLADASSGGIWTSTATIVATIGSTTGVVTGVTGTSGTSMITYTLPGGCIATANMTVNVTPAAITGPNVVCQASTITLGDLTSGGNWSSSSTGQATIGSTGIVSGISAGTPFITYQMPVTGCNVTYQITVNPLPASITGTLNVCAASTSTLYDATSGGAWSSSNTSIAMIGSATGGITGVAAGSVTYTYTLPTGCLVTATGSVNPLPAIYTVLGGGSYCAGGSGIDVSLSNSASGITYKLYNSGSLVTSNSGTGSALDFGFQTAAGTYTITGTNVVTGCVSNMTSSATVVMNPLPTQYNMTGGGALCPGGSAVALGLNGSQSTGISYQMYRGGTTVVGAPVFGTGSSISFASQTTAGTYTAIATNTVTGCTNSMLGSEVVTVNPAPTAYLVTGGGAYCTGSTGGVHIFLNGSASGVNYTVTNGSASNTLPGTGSSLDFGGFTSVGTYTVSAINVTTGCTAAMMSSANVTVNPLPAVVTLSASSASYCLGGTGVTLNLSSVASGVSYQLYLTTPYGTSPVGSAITSPTTSFGLETGVGTYSAIAMNTTTTCTVSMTGTPAVTTNALPAVHIVGGGGTYCTGGSGVYITLDTAVSGITYKLTRTVAGVTTTVTSTTPGSTGPLTTAFGLQTVSGTYGIVAVNGSGCAVSMFGAPIVAIATLPNAYAMTGGGNYCSGGTGVAVGVSPTDAGVSYELYYNGVPVGTPVAGTSSAISFGVETLAGTYSVIGTNPLTTCSVNMLTTALVSVNPLPTQYSVTGGGSYCTGGTGVDIRLSGSQSGVSYQLYNASATSGIAMLGSGSVVDFGNSTAAGSYTAIATNTGTSCSVNMLSSATVLINTPPTAYTVGGGGSYCAGLTGTAPHITLGGSASGVTYQLYNGSTAVGTALSGTGFGLDFGQYATVGTYSVTATSGTSGCTVPMTGTVTVTTNPAPNVYTVTGGGSYCAGGTGVPVGLSGSDFGVTYTVSINGVPVGTPYPGSGSALSFGLHTGTGLRTVVATGSTGCTSNMAGSVTVSVNPVPVNTYSVTGGGGYCSGGSGVSVGLSSSSTGINYQLYDGSVPVGLAMAGTNIALPFGNQTETGIYTVVGMDAVTGCTSTMTGSVVVSVNPAPTAYVVGGTGGYCVGTSGATITLSSSSASATYQLYNGSTAVGSSVAGTGTGLTFGPESATGVYSIVAKDNITSCTNNMTGTIIVSLNPVPNAYSITGGGSYCAGGTGLAVGLANSDVSMSYQLQKDGVALGSPLAGTGSSLNFGMQTAAGTYTIVGTNSVTGCTNAMTGSTSITISANPVVYSVMGGGSYCATGAGRDVSLTSSDAGINYQLYNGMTASGVAIGGTGSSIDFGMETAAGTYTVVATDALSGCTSNMSSAAVIVINPLPGTYSVTGGGAYCAGGTGELVGLAGSNSGITYQLYNNGMAVGTAMTGTGASINFGLETAAGTYTVIATNSSTLCTSSMTSDAVVVINPLPAIDTVTGGGNYCPGGAGLHIGLNTSSTGVNYQLYRGVTAIAFPVAGTGSALDFGAQTVTGTYFVTATNATTGCSVSMAGSTPIGISTPPTAFTVHSSASSYCLGGSGVSLSMSGSTIGVDYQLYRGSIMVGSTVAGSGFPVSFGLETAAGTYYVVATSTLTGCVDTMAGMPAVSISTLPTLYTVTGGGSYCAGGSGIAIGVGGSDVGVSYQLYNGATSMGSAVIGTGFAISFGPITPAGTYTVTATNTSGCTSNMLSSAVINVNPAPTAYLVDGGGSYCAGSAGVHVGLSASDLGVNYQLYDGGTLVGTALAGLSGSAPLDFGAQTVSGTYTVKATNPTTGCTSTMTGSVPVSVNPVPTPYTVTGGGNYCIGGTGVHIGLSGSALTTTYQLLKNGTALGSSTAGSGSSIDFGLETSTGTYTVTAVNSFGCMDTMAGTTVITVSPLPNTYTVTGGGSYCSASSGAAIGLDGSQSGVNYRLYDTTTAIGGVVGGTGSSVSFGLHTTGTYTVVATDVATGCSVAMAGSATTSPVTAVVPSVAVATGTDDTVCSGTYVTFSAVPTNGGVSPTYQWYVNGSLAGTGASYGYIPLDGNVVSVTMTSDASCVFPATASGSVTMIVRSGVTPSISISASTNDTICQGTSVNFTATGTNGGLTPLYTWYVNGDPMGAGTHYSYAPANGDVVFCTLSSSDPCRLLNTVLSNNIRFTVDSNVLPSVTLATHLGFMSGGIAYNDTIDASVIHPGRNPSYQWEVNSSTVLGVNSSVLYRNTFNNGDVVTCVVSNVNACGILDGSAEAIITIANVGVQQVSAKGDDITVVPNPSKGLFVVKGDLGVTSDEEVTIELTDVIGQVIYTGKVMSHNGTIDQTVKLNKGIANGMYLLNVQSASVSKVFHLAIEQ